MPDQCEKASKAARERGDYDTQSDEKIKQAIWRGFSQCIFDEKSILSSYLKWCRMEVKTRFPDKRDCVIDPKVRNMVCRGGRNGDKCEKASKAARERGDYDTQSDEKIKQAIWRGLSPSLFDEKIILSSNLKWCHREVKARVPDKHD
ncbi:hypothetical protein Bca101_025044 [Brassica carinata]